MTRPDGALVAPGWVVQIVEVGPEQVTRFLGSGSLISLDPPQVLTAWHVIRDAHFDRVRVRGGWLGLGAAPPKDRRVLEDEDAALLLLGTGFRVPGEAPRLDRRPAVIDDLPDLRLAGFTEINENSSIFKTHVAGRLADAGVWRVADARGRGFSGGPAIRDGAIAGLIVRRNTDRSETYVLPLAAAPALFEPLPPLADEAVSLEAVVAQLYRPRFARCLIGPLGGNVSVAESARRADTLDRGFRHVLSADDPHLEGEPTTLLQLIIPPVEGGLVLTRLQGVRGSGASTILYALNALCCYRHEVDPTTPLPIFVDLRRYEGADLDDWSEIVARIRDDILQIKRTLAAEDAEGVLLLVEAVDISETPGRIVSAFAKAIIDSKKRFIGVVAASTSWPFRAIMRELSTIGVTDLVISGHRTFLLSEFHFEAAPEPERRDFCRAALELDHVLTAASGALGAPEVSAALDARADALKDRLEGLKLPFITYPMRKLALDALEDYTLAGLEIDQFLERQCARSVQEALAEAGIEKPTADRMRAHLDRLADLAIASFREEAGLAARPPDCPPELEAARLRLIEQQAITRDHLVARFVMNRFSEAGRASDVPTATAKLVNDERLDFDFPRSVNTLCCRRVTTHGQADVVLKVVFALLDNADRLIDTGRFRLLNFAVYLAARVTQQPKKTRTLLRSHRDRVEKRLASPQSTNDELSETDILLLTSLRCAEVSLIRLKDLEAADRYVNHVLDLDCVSQVNLGFHLLYYGDRTPSGEAINDYLDLPNDADGLCSWRSTRSALINGIQRGAAEISREEAPHEDFALQVATVVRFVETRGGPEELDRMPATTAALERVRAALDRRPVAAPSALRGRVEALLRDRSRGRGSLWRAVTDIYALKLEARAGWVARGLPQLDPSQRVESVAEHVLFAAKLALILLPSDDHGENGYNRARVIEILLCHDDGEALIGDHIVTGMPSRREAVAVCESAAIRYLAAELAANGAPGGRAMTMDFESFEAEQDINGALARDIDRLENLIQLGVYALAGRIGDDERIRFFDDVCGRINPTGAKGLRTEVQNHAFAFRAWLEERLAEGSGAAPYRGFRIECDLALQAADRAYRR